MLMSTDIICLSSSNVFSYLENGFLKIGLFHTDSGIDFNLFELLKFNCAEIFEMDSKMFDQGTWYIFDSDCKRSDYNGFVFLCWSPTV